jgi:hypothetical protein
MPTNFEENDDVSMCLIASGAYTGTPEPHLIFIHYFYGLILAFLYKAFNGIEWYTISFCIMHIISSSIIVYIFLRIRKSISVKIVSLVLFYALELTNIQSLQFTTTAAIAAFAGILLLFEKERFYVICGMVLFFIGSFIRFQSAMLVMLLMLPFFIYKTVPNIRKNVKIIIPVAICIFGAFILQIFDKQAYNGESWSAFREYNDVRGQILGNPNRVLIINELPNDISQGDYYLFLYHFIDGKVFNLEKIKKLSNLITDISLSEKIKNVLPFVSYNKWILSIILISFGIFFFSAKEKKTKLFILFYLIYISIIMLYITLDGRINQRVFMSIFFPLLYFLYRQASPFSKKELKIVYLFLLISLTLLFINNIYRISVYRDYTKETIIKEEMAILGNLKNKNITVLGFAADLQVENLCSPFEISKYFSNLSLVGSGWATNSPYNAGSFDSYLSLVEKDIYLFISLQNQFAIPIIQDSLKNNYDCETDVALAIRTDNYLLVKFIEK